VLNLSVCSISINALKVPKTVAMFHHNLSKKNEFDCVHSDAATRRHDAASWLRRTVGVVCARDLPDEPSEEEFQLGLRNGIVLCNALNKAQPGAISKVAEHLSPSMFYVMWLAMVRDNSFLLRHNTVGCRSPVRCYYPCRWFSYVCISVL
jgi:hypothetical protein